jgi:hypothetical protein
MSKYDYIHSEKDYDSLSKGTSQNRNVMVAAFSRPITGMETGGSGGNAFKARPIKHWRKQLNPRPGSGVNGRRAGIGMFSDMPGGSTVLGKTSTSCTDTSTSECTTTSTILTENILRTNNTTNFGSGAVYDSTGKCIACNPIANLIKPATTILSKKYYTGTHAYLQSRCLTYDQKLSANKIPGITYFNTTTNTPVLPSNSATGSQVRATQNCTRCESTNQTNSGTTIYKPSNYQYATQGAVTSSARLARIKYNVVNQNSNTFGSAFGVKPTYNASGDAPYFLKSKNQNTCQRFYRNGKKTKC